MTTAMGTADKVSTPGLPGKAVPYRLEAGTGRAFLLQGMVNRFLASEAETAGAMSVTDVVAPAGRPIPPHYHDERYAQHDLFYCVHGRVRVWADDESRILTPGDVASVPPGTVHSLQMLDHYSEMLGPVVPWRWIRFSEMAAPGYEGPAYPPVDNSPPPAREHLERAVAEGLLTPVPDYPFPEERLDAADDQLPDGPVPYFLRAGEGPRHLLFGQVCFQLLTGAQSSGRMAMTVTEGARGPGFPSHVHEHTYEGIFCLDGRMRVTTAGEVHELIRGDFVNIPAGVEHDYALDANFTRFATITAPAGTELLYELAGEPAEQRIFPPQADPPDLDRLIAATADIDIEFVS